MEDFKVKIIKNKKNNQLTLSLSRKKLGLAKNQNPHSIFINRRNIIFENGKKQKRI